MTSLATTRQFGSKFIVYSPGAVVSFPGRLFTNRPGKEAKSAGARLNKGGAPAPGAPPLPTPLIYMCTILLASLKHRVIGWYYFF